MNSPHSTTHTLQIFWNILRNAIKYTPPGGRIRVTTSNDSKSIKVFASRLVLSVSLTRVQQIDFEDNGMGLSPDFLPLVFEPFRQGGRGQGGLGLGLGMCISKASHTHPINGSDISQMLMMRAVDRGPPRRNHQRVQRREGTRVHVYCEPSPFLLCNRPAAERRLSALAAGRAEGHAAHQHSRRRG